MPEMRGHNEGTVFRRRTGQWVSAVTMRDGRRASRTTHSRVEANAALTELLRLRDAGAPITERIRLGDYLERWVTSDHGWAPATRSKHESAVRVHLARGPLGHLRVSEVSVGDVDRWLGGLVGLSAQSRRHLRSTLRRALADAHREGLVTRNVGALSRSPGLSRRERTVLDATQARTLIESTRGTRYGPLWTILVTTGLRISEALGLAWSDVDMGGADEFRRSVARDGGAGLSGVAKADRAGDDGHDPAPSRFRGGVDDPANDARGLRQGLANGDVRGAAGPTLTVRHQLAREGGEWVRRPPKTAKGRRTIPLTALGVEALQAQRDQQRQDRGITATDGLVFTNSRGYPLHGENTGKVLARDLAAAGLPRVTQHQLRHSAATLLFAQGVPLAVISRILGHSTIRITADFYTHNVDALNREAADQMQEALGG